MLKCILNKLRHIAKMTKFVSPQEDGNDLYNAQVSYLGMTNQSYILYPYGLFANPPANAMGVTLNIMAHQENQVTIPFHPLKRFTGLKPGEVIVGNADKQTSIKFDEKGNVEITSTGDVTVLGNLLVTGEITAFSGSANELSISDIRNDFNSHVHTVFIDSITFITTKPDNQI